MKLKDLTNLDLLAFIENASELFRLRKYRSKEFTEDYIGLGVHRSGFYGMYNPLTDETKAINRDRTVFDSEDDITIQIEGVVNLSKIPVNNGAGEIVYSGYGVLEVPGSGVVYDGRGGGGSITARSTIGNFPDTVIQGVTVGPDIDHRIENQGGEDVLVIGDPYVAPLFSAFSIDGQPTTIEAGDVIPAGVNTFDWAVVDTGGNLTPNDITIRDVDAAVDLATGLANDGTEDINIGPAVQLLAGDTQQYRISSGQAQGGDITRNFTVTGLWAVYSGSNALTNLTEADVEALVTKQLKSGFSGNYALPASGYKWICYPTTMGTATTFTDTGTGFPVAMNDFGGGLTYELVSVTNAFGQTVDYKCHRTLNQLGSAITIAVS